MVTLTIKAIMEPGGFRVTRLSDCSWPWGHGWNTNL